jgi:hypothetical protein
VLHTFCEIFLLEVNTRKTEVLVLRKRGHVLHAHQLVLMYQGAALRFVPEAKYLGLLYHEHGDYQGMVDKLLTAGKRACFALQARLKLIPALSVAAKLTLFKNLVLPILTYGCQVWGVHFLSLPTSTFSSDSKASVPDNPFDAIWLNYLRFVFCVGKFACRWSLLHEARFDFIQKHFARCVTRFWSKLHSDEVPHISVHAAKADVRLMLAGNKQCWSYLFFRFLHQLGVDLDSRLHPLFEQSRRHRNNPVHESLFDIAWNVQVAEADTLTKLHNFWHERVWNAVHEQNPRAAGIEHARLCKYVAWSGTTAGSAAARQYHKYLYTCLPSRLHACMARFRLGCWTCLSVHAAVLARGRNVSGNPPSIQCRSCGVDTIEDEKHVAFECRQFESIRCKYPSLFKPDGTAMHADLRSWLQSCEPRDVASFLCEIYESLKPCSSLQ